MKKRITALLLLLSVCIGILLACQTEQTDNKEKDSGTQSSGNGTEDGDVTYDASNILEQFEKKNFDDKVFRVACANYFNNTIFIRQAPTEDADPADLINSELYNRDMKLEDQYGVTIEYTISSDDKALVSDLELVVGSGEDIADMVLGSLWYLGGNMLQENLLLDMNVGTGIDFTNNWWNQNMIEYFTLNNKTFLATGDITTRGQSSVTLLLFNMPLFNDDQIEYPYQDVYDGTWTYDKFFEIYNQKSVDLNQDGQLNIADDKIGFLASGAAGYFGCDGRYTVRNSDGSFAPAYDSAKAVDMLQRFQEWYNEDVLHDTYYPGVDCFMNNRAYFIEAAGCDLSLFRAMEDDFGALPFPKYAEEQKDYVTFANSWITTCAAIPLTAPDAAFSGFMTEAMAALSKYTTSQKQYEIVMQNKELRDDDSKKMLEIFVRTTTYDIGFNYDFGGIRSVMEGILKNDFDVVSNLEAIGSGFEVQLEEFLEVFQ